MFYFTLAGVGLLARLPNTSGSEERSPETQLLEVEYKSTWTGVCGDGFGTAEAVVGCRMLKGKYPSAVRYTYVNGSMDMGLAGFTCEGTESDFSQCRNMSGNLEQCQDGLVHLTCTFGKDFKSCAGLSEQTLPRFFYCEPSTCAGKKGLTTKSISCHNLQTV